jgi:hypothetical protein
MQICVQDVFVTNFSRLTCYDIVLLINYGATSAFCMHVVHDTSYDTPIVSSLKDMFSAVFLRTCLVQLSTSLQVEFLD